MDDPKPNIPERDFTNRRDDQENLSGDLPETERETPRDTPAIDETHKGKRVFSPNELNQSGEDKEYFPPAKDHKFNVPKDANNHALTPDVEVAPGNTVKTQK